MAWSRYAFAADLGAGGDVLEIACGVGQGLGCLADRARHVVGGDYTWALASRAHQEYGGGIPVVRFDAAALPFREAAFDAIVLFEAIYYLPDVDAFLAECRRVLRPQGRVIIATVNPEWTDFNPSPFSVRYLAARELQDALEAHGFDVRLCGAFSTVPATSRGALVSLLKRAAVRLGVIPKTMRGKQLLKRLFLGPLVDAPRRLAPGRATYHPPQPLASPSEAPRFKVIYAVGRR